MFQVTYVDLHRLDEEPDDVRSNDAFCIVRGGLGVAQYMPFACYGPKNIFFCRHVGNLPNDSSG